MQAGASCVTLSELSNEELPSIKRQRALFRRSLAQWRPCSPEESCFKNTACSRLRRGFCRKQLLCELTWTKCPVFMSPISRGRPINDLLIFTMEMRIWKPRGASEELFYSWWSIFYRVYGLIIGEIKVLKFLSFNCFSLFQGEFLFSCLMPRKIIIVFFLWGNLFSLTGHIYPGKFFSFQTTQNKIFFRTFSLHVEKKKSLKKKKEILNW